jgi:hypothetical protein
MYPDAAAGDDDVAGTRCSRRDSATMSAHGRETDSRTVSRLIPVTPPRWDPVHSSVHHTPVHSV